MHGYEVIYKPQKQEEGKTNKKPRKTAPAKKTSKLAPSLLLNKMGSGLTLKFRKDEVQWCNTESRHIDNICYGRGFSFEASLIPLLPYVAEMTVRKEDHRIILPLIVPTTNFQASKRSKRYHWSTPTALKSAKNRFSYLLCQNTIKQ